MVAVVDQGLARLFPGQRLTRRPIAVDVLLGASVAGFSFFITTSMLGIRLGGSQTEGDQALLASSRRPKAASPGSGAPLPEC